MTPAKLSRLAALKAMDLDRLKWPDVAARLKAELADLQAELASRPAVEPAALLERAKARARELGVDHGTV